MTEFLAVERTAASALLAEAGSRDGMPVSPYRYLNENCALMVREFPTSVLDVGVGHGKWGFLCRDTLEAFVGSRYFKRDWKLRVDGIEVFADYHNPVWDYAYDHVWIGDACDLLPALDVYDLILALEVIEHTEKASGLALLGEMVRHAVRGVVLSFPDAESPDALVQGESYGNPHERHRSLWSPGDVAAYACEALSPTHVFVRDPGKRRIAAVELASQVNGAHVVRHAAKGCEQPSQPWLVLCGPGSTLRVPFTGTRAHVYFVRHGFCGAADVRIDGTPVARVPLFVPGAAQYGCWRTPPLPAGPHVLELEALADGDPTRSEVWLDDVVLER